MHLSLRFFLFCFFLCSFVFSLDSKGYVYVLENPSIKGIVKIGCTKHLVQRIDELYTTGVVLPYRLCFSKEFSSEKEAHKIERDLHRRYAKYRVDPRREFFDKSVTNKVKQTLKSYKGRYISASSFEKEFLLSYGVHAKEKLFFRKDKNIVVTLLSSFKVRYNGTIYSLKELSSVLLGREIKYKELASLWCSKSGTLLKDLNVLQGGL